MADSFLVRPSVTELAQACSDRDIEMLEYGLRGSRPSAAELRMLVTEACGVEGSTLLHAAAESGDTQIVDLVLRCGGNQHKTDFNGALPLHYAAARGFADVCERLLKAAPGTVHHLEKDGATPFLWAAAGGKFEAGRVLRKWGADISAVNKEQGWTALHYAVSVGSVPFVQLMMSASGAVDIDALDREGRTALHLACRGGWATIVEMLVAAGADPTRRTNSGDTAAELCVSKAAFDALTLTQPGKAGVAPINPANAPSAPAPPPASYPVRDSGAGAQGQPLVPQPPASRPGAVNNPVRAGRATGVVAK